MAGKPRIFAILLPVGFLFYAYVQEHDYEGEEDHDGAGVDDDLGGGEELRAEEEIEDGKRTHDHDQREGAVDRVSLEQEVDRSRQTECREDQEED